MKGRGRFNQIKIFMILTDWVTLLNRPMTILGPYKGKIPPLATFAPHAWGATFNEVSISGQFMQLPEQVPPSWSTPEPARADVVFEFLGVRLLRVEGVLERSNEDDQLHGMPCGIPGECSLTAMLDLCLDDVEKGLIIPWKQFKFMQPEFSMLIEASDVSITCGRRASNRRRPWE
jgi:hypothetical protein